MRLLLFILFFLPMLCIAQSEREEKLRIKKGETLSTISSNEAQSKIVQKKASNPYEKQIFGPEPIFSPSRSYWNDNDWRWRMLGAPVSGFIDFTPSYYYDVFGFRQPSRIYRMADGQTKVVKGEKTHWRIGLSYNNDNQLGGWVTIGNKTFFIAEYCSNIANDKSSFLPNLTMDQVLLWNDRKLDDIKLGGILHVGAGIKYKRIGFYVAPGYGWATHNFQFFDELFILSNNGNYSFPNYKESFFTGKIGVLADIKMISMKLDYNPFRNHIGIGAGIVF